MLKKRNMINLKEASSGHTQRNRNVGFLANSQIKEV